MTSTTPHPAGVEPFPFDNRNVRGVPDDVPAAFPPAPAPTQRPGGSGRSAIPAQPLAPARRPRKQWGGDRRTRALPMVPEPVSDRRVAMARLAIIVTVTAWLGYLITWFFQDFFHPGYENAVDRAESVLYLLIVTLLTVSALAYLLSRLGFFYRTRTHHRASRATRPPHRGRRCTRSPVSPPAPRRPRLPFPCHKLQPAGPDAAGTCQGARRVGHRAGPAYYRS